MKRKEIYILCNSAECLSMLTSGELPDLSFEDIFTCNNAFTFFRTNARHLNFFTDTIDIMRHVIMPETLTKEYEKKIEFIYSMFGMELKNGNLIYRQLKFSPINKGCTSGLGALAYLSLMEDYDTIYMIGYTMDESFNNIWDDILFRYDKNGGTYMLEFTLKKTAYENNYPGE